MNIFIFLLLIEIFGSFGDIYITRGSGEHLQIYYRDILKVILNDRCTYTIIAHNHPDGSALPGRVDISNMRKLTQLLKPIGVTLRDQYIVGRDGAYSCNLERYLYKQ